MQDFKQRRTAPQKPWLKRRLRLGLGRRGKVHLPKGFRPLPVPPASKREASWQWPKLQLVRPPLALIHGALVLWLVAGVCWNGWNLLHAPLQKVRLSGNIKVTGAQVLAAAGLAPGLSMAALDPIQITRRVAAEPNVAAVDVRRVYPGAVWIDVQERAPDLRVQANGAAAVVDTHDVVIATGTGGPDASALPLVRGTGIIPAPGEVLLDPGLQRAREFRREMEQAGLPVDQVAEVDTTRPYMLSVRFADGRRVLFSADDVPAELRIFRDLSGAPALQDTLAGHSQTLDLRASTMENGRVVLRQ